MKVKDKPIIEQIRKQYHNPLYKLFLELFEATIEMNHDRLDASPLGEVKRYQGQNQLLRKYIRELSASQ